MAMPNLLKVLALLLRILLAGSCEVLSLRSMNLQADEVFIIGHHDCGMNSIDTDVIIEDMVHAESTKAFLKHLNIQVST